VLQKSAKIALVNLGNVSRSLQRAFADTEMLAAKKLQARKELLSRIPAGLALLDSIKIHPVFGKEEQTLGEFFTKDEIDSAREVCVNTHEEVEQRIKELKKTMEEFIYQGEGLKGEVLGWEPDSIQDGGHVREISLIADKIERGTIPVILANETSTIYRRCMTRQPRYRLQSAHSRIIHGNISPASKARRRPC